MLQFPNDWWAHGMADKSQRHDSLAYRPVDLAALKGAATETPAALPVDYLQQPIDFAYEAAAYLAGSSEK